MWKMNWSPDKSERWDTTLNASAVPQLREKMGGGPDADSRERGVARFEIHFAGLAGGLHRCQSYGE